MPPKKVDLSQIEFKTATPEDFESEKDVRRLNELLDQLNKDSYIPMAIRLSETRQKLKDILEKLQYLSWRANLGSIERFIRKRREEIYRRQTKKEYIAMCAHNILEKYMPPGHTEIALDGEDIISMGSFERRGTWPDGRAVYQILHGVTHADYRRNKIYGKIRQALMRKIREKDPSAIIITRTVSPEIISHMESLVKEGRTVSEVSSADFCSAFLRYEFPEDDEELSMETAEKRENYRKYLPQMIKNEKDEGWRYFMGQEFFGK